MGNIGVDEPVKRGSTLVGGSKRLVWHELQIIKYARYVEGQQSTQESPGAPLLGFWVLNHCNIICGSCVRDRSGVFQCTRARVYYFVVCTPRLICAHIRGKP